MSLSDLFIDTGATCPVGGEPLIPDDGFGLVQLIFLTLVYGYILASSSKMIADGSELLLLVMNPGVVGETSGAAAGKKRCHTDATSGSGCAFPGHGAPMRPSPCL